MKVVHFFFCFLVSIQPKYPISNGPNPKYPIMFIRFFSTRNNSITQTHTLTHIQCARAYALRPRYHLFSRWRSSSSFSTTPKNIKSSSHIQNYTHTRTYTMLYASMYIYIAYQCQLLAILRKIFLVQVRNKITDLR